MEEAATFAAALLHDGVQVAKPALSVNGVPDLCPVDKMTLPSTGCYRHRIRQRLTLVLRGQAPPGTGDVHVSRTYRLRGELAPLSAQQKRDKRGKG